MLGKTFKGLTDATLEWQTAEFLARETRREGHIVHVRPELVVEIAFNDLQASPHYPGGLALRFARLKRYRPDKTAAEADTIDTVRALYAAQNRKAQALSARSAILPACPTSSNPPRAGAPNAAAARARSRAASCGSASDCRTRSPTGR
jgi:hypothetical protein